MSLIVAFVLGTANFALHKAVLESGHPLLRQAPWLFELLGGRFSLILEFAMLLGTMLLVASGASGWLWLYFAYTTMNAASAWLILTGRI